MLEGVVWSSEYLEAGQEVDSCLLFFYGAEVHKRKQWEALLSENPQSVTGVELVVTAERSS